MVKEVFSQTQVTSEPKQDKLPHCVIAQSEEQHELRRHNLLQPLCSLLYASMYVHFQMLYELPYSIYQILLLQVSKCV